MVVYVLLFWYGKGLQVISQLLTMFRHLRIYINVQRRRNHNHQYTFIYEWCVAEFRAKPPILIFCMWNRIIVISIHYVFILGLPVCLFLYFSSFNYFIFTFEIFDILFQIFVIEYYAFEKVLFVVLLRYFKTDFRIDKKPYQCVSKKKSGHKFNQYVFF